MAETKLAELFDLHGGGCWRLALVLAGGDAWIAERIVADAFLLAARHGRVEPGRTERTWLLCLVRRCAPGTTRG